MLTQVSFALLSFYGWHAPKGGQLLFRFLLLSGFFPHPFATYHFFLPLFLSLLFSRFTRPSFFLAAPVAMVIVWFSTLFVPLFFPCASFWIFLALLIHLSHFSYFQHLYVFPDFGYQRFFPENSGAPFSFRHLSGFFLLFIAFLFFNTPFAILLLATLWNIAIFEAGYLSPPFRIELSHTLSDLTARRKAQRKARRKNETNHVRQTGLFVYFSRIGCIF